MGCGASSVPSDIVYKNGTPDFKPTEVAKCFKDNDNGLCFRLVNAKKKEWAFYNDTKEYEMHVKVIFEKEGCEIAALGKTNLQTLPDGKMQASVVVYPLETEMFIKGVTNGFKSTCEALPLSAEYKARQAEKK